jgi:hypothetical protein
MAYGIYFIKTGKMEVYQDKTGVAKAAGLGVETLTKRLQDHGGNYMGHMWIVTNDVEVFKSRRGNG